jgi:HEAT repeat protein
MRKRSAIARISLALAALLCATGSLRAEDKARDAFRTAKPKLQTRLHKRQIEDRVEAVNELKRYPTVDAVKLLMVSLSREKALEVHEAAYETLLTFKDDAEICDYLLATVTKDSSKRGGVETTAMLLAVLLGSDLEDVERDVLALLETLGATPDGLYAAESLVDGLGEHAKPDDAARLKKLLKLKVYDREFGFRRALAAAAGKIEDPAGVDVLISMITGKTPLNGEIAADVVQFLTDATGQKHANDSDAWGRWWDENKETFKYPVGVKHSETRTVARGAGSEYYGMSLYAQRMLFVIDVSGSMAGQRLMAAKRELVQTIDGLSPDTQFNIIAYNSRVNPWQRRMMKAERNAKEAAGRWIMGLEAATSTATYDALETALENDSEAIYLLTDGVPHGGKIDSPPDIVEAVSHLNRAKRMSIYTIGIGVGAAGQGFDQFLEALAKQNFGRYRRVDQ